MRINDLQSAGRQAASGGPDGAGDATQVVEVLSAGKVCPDGTRALDPASLSIREPEVITRRESEIVPET